MLNNPENTALFNFETQYPCYKEVLHKAQGLSEKARKSVIFDMDISPGDIITLLYLLKQPRHIIDLKAISVSSTGWSNAATIDVVYDVLHMMGRDDIPVGLGEFFALGQAYPPLESTGNCRYRQWIPNGAGGFIDSDTLFGLARDLPRSPRRYTAENSVLFGAPRNTDNPGLRQQKAQEVIVDVLERHGKNEKLVFLTGGPLTDIATFLASNSTTKPLVKEIYIAGGSIAHGGNLYTLPGNTKSEFNFFLDPLAAQRTLQSNLSIFLAPLHSLKKTSFAKVLLDALDAKKETPEARFVHKLLLMVHQLKLQSDRYAHAAKLLEEVVAAVAMVETTKWKGYWKQAYLIVEATGDVNMDGWTRVDSVTGRKVEYLDQVSAEAAAKIVADALNSSEQSAVVGSFAEQVRTWTTTCNY